MADAIQQPQAAETGDADAAAAAAVTNEHLNLKVKSQDGNEVYFKVIAAYCVTLTT
jgi:hypothetical protein